MLHASVKALLEALAAIEDQIARLDEQLKELARRSPVCWRLMSVPGVGPIVALVFIHDMGQHVAVARHRHAGAAVHKEAIAPVIGCPVARCKIRGGPLSRTRRDAGIDALLARRHAPLIFGFCVMIGPSCCALRRDGCGGAIAAGLSQGQA